MYISEFCDVKYEENYNVVFVKWKKYCCKQEYRKPLEYALNIIKEHKNCDYVADTRSGFKNAPEDTKWVAEYFMPTAAEYGCKSIYFIIDKNNSLKEELEGQERDSCDKIGFEYIYDLHELKKNIILLNGPSSSGKSTLAKLLQEQNNYPIVSIDDYLDMSTDEPIYEDDVYAISGTMCKKVLETLKTSKGVIIDHVITSERIFEQLKIELGKHNIFTVKIICPVEILKEREMARKDRCPGSAEASYEYLYPKDGYDLTVDTNSVELNENVKRIIEVIQ